MSDFQNRVIKAIERHEKHQNSVSIVQLTNYLKSNFLAVYSSCKSLEKQGLIISFRHGRDQWATLEYALNKPIATAN